MYVPAVAPPPQVKYKYSFAAGSAVRGLVVPTAYLTLLFIFNYHRDRLKSIWPGSSISAKPARIFSRLSGVSIFLRTDLIAG